MKKIIITICVLFLNCTDNTDEEMRLFASITDSTAPITERRAGVCLSFDDYTKVANWIEYHDTHGKSRNWRASFFMNIGSDTEALRTGVKYLYDEGHEIENHTATHYNGVNTWMNSGNDEEGYYNTHLKPLDDWLIDLGIPKPEVLRYPYNYINKDVTDWLVANNKYKIITPGIGTYQTPWNLRPYHAVYNYDYYAEGVTTDYRSDYSPDDIMDLVKYCDDNNKVVVFYGHFIGEAGVGSSDFNLINQIIDYCNSNNMKMYLMSELADLDGTPTDIKNTCVGNIRLVTQSGGTFRFYLKVLGEDRNTHTYNLKFNIYNNGVLYASFDDSLTDINVDVTDLVDVRLTHPSESGTFNFTASTITENGAEVMLDLTQTITVL